MKIEKAVIPAAGFGTRFLPITKAIPKEMLPLIDKPVIHHVVEEAVTSGIKKILIITSYTKKAIEDYFDVSLELETMLERMGKKDMIKEIRKISDLADFYYVRQKEQKGLGDAIKYADNFVDNEPFAVLLGDTIVDTKVPCTQTAIELYQKYKTNIVAVEKVPKEKIQRYGIVDGIQKEEYIFEVKRLVEKPKPETINSNLAIVGRYIFTPDIFESLDNTKPGLGGEIQLTDALQLQLKKQKIYAFTIDGKRYDIGSKADYIDAIMNFVLKMESQNVYKEY